MTISVVIPAYNEEEYLPKTLDSLNKLDRKPDEVIIVDGSSTDRTAAIAKSYGAVVISVPKRTIGYSRQEGLKKARGDIIACTDADTVVPRNWLNMIEETLSRPGVSGTYGKNFLKKEPHQGPLFIYVANSLMPLVWSISSSLGLHIGGGFNIAFWRTKALQAGGFPIHFKSVEDYEILKRLTKVGKVLYNPRNIVISSGRRGKEGIGVIFRVASGYVKYFLTGKADTFDFPDIR